jgi:hypothetical protein
LWIAALALPAGSASIPRQNLRLIEILDDYSQNMHGYRFRLQPGFSRVRRLFRNSSGVEEEPGDARSATCLRCVGADRPKAQPFIEEVDGILVHICPKSRTELEKIDAILSRK